MVGSGKWAPFPTLSYEIELVHRADYFISCDLSCRRHSAVGRRIVESPKMLFHAPERAGEALVRLATRGVAKKEAITNQSLEQKSPVVDCKRETHGSIW